MARYNSTERIGVSAVENIFTKELGWIFREQHESDVGVDAHVEIVDDEPTGILFGLQIKSGASYLKGNDRTLYYYLKNVHIEYWLNHSLEIFVIIHDPNKNLTYWQIVKEENIQQTSGNGWKLNIPKDNLLKSSAKTTIKSLVPDLEWLKRENKLLTQKSIIEKVVQGKKVILEFIIPVHKTFKKTDFVLKLEDETGNEIELSNWPVGYAGYEVNEAIRVFLPWAIPEIDQEYYDIHYDEESVTAIYPKPKYFKIYPYEIPSYEFARYRVLLKANEIGKSYLIYRQYVERGL